MTTLLAMLAGELLSIFGKKRWTNASARPLARPALEPLEGRIAPSGLIRQIPFTITAPGTYKLAADFHYGANYGNALTVTASDVVIDFNGHNLWSATGAATTAMGIVAKQESNITIENGTIQGFQIGIQLAGETAYGNTVQNMVLANNWYIGIWVDGASSAVVNNLVENTGASDIPGYTIPIGIHVAGSSPTVDSNRITGLLWYPGVTQEVIGLAINDAPGAAVAGNAFVQAQLTNNSWGLWVNSANDDYSTMVDLESNSFTNIQVGCALSYSCAQAKNNQFFNVPTMWSMSSPNSLTDLGGNLEFPVAETPSTQITTDEPTFFWAPASGADTYELSIHDQNTQAVLTVPNLPASATSYTLTGTQALTYGDSFVWSVAAVSAKGTALAWSNGLSFSITALGAPTPSTPNTQAATDEPTFTWVPAVGTGPAPASYELCIQDQNTQADLTIPNLPVTSTSYTLTAAQALTPGDSFEWWIAASSADAGIITWSNGVNFSIAALGAPAPVTLNSQRTNDQPTFSWTAAAGTGPGSYELWIQDQNTQAVLTVPNLPAAATSYTLTAAQALTPGDSFNWWVAAVSTNGKAIAWTNGGNCSITALGAPAAVTPNAQLTTDQPTFSWTAAAGTGPGCYELWIQDQNTQVVLTIPNLPVTSTSYTLTAAQALTPGDTFNWWVAAVSTNDKAIVWTNGGNCSIMALGAPAAVTPNTQLTIDQPTFSWAASAGTGPETYELWIQDQNTQAVLTVPNLPATSTSYTLTAAQALTPGDTFNWWVAAVSTNGKAIAWTDGGNCSIAALGAPTAITPNTQLTTDEPTFSWTAPVGAGPTPASYELWIQDQYTKSVVAVPNLSINSTSCTLTAAQSLTPGDIFNWWVAAVSTNAKTIVWSNGGNFSIAALGAPAANTPNTQIVTAQATFAWTAAAGIGPGSYELCIQDLYTQSVLTIPNLPVTSKSYTLTAAQALTPGHSVKWWVAAVSTNAEAIAWSNGVSFSISA